MTLHDIGIAVFKASSFFFFKHNDRLRSLIGFTDHSGKCVVSLFFFCSEYGYSYPLKV